MESQDEIKRINKERKYFFIIVPVLLLIALIGISLAFFNYTRTGAGNIIRVGRISFVSKNEQTITLNNLFPIDPTETGIMNDSTKVGTYSIDITGDTDYANGIEYLVSVVDANIYTSTGQAVPISLNVTVEDLGTSNNNYFTARESANTSIYKKIVGDTLVGDQMLLVGFIAPNDPTGTADGIDGSITIKAYIDKDKVKISDTYDGTESDNMGTTNEWAEGKTVITTSEWNALQSTGVSFKVKVEANEGIWVKGSLEEIMKVQNLNTTTSQPIRDDQQSTYVTGANGIDFSKISGDTDDDGVIDNGKGVYMRAGTQNDTYPILYYRGAVDDNNVMFANQCWKIVRTTDTGGVKLIYNGEKSPAYIQEFTDPDTYATEYEKDIFTFDSTDSTWNYEVNDGKDHEIAFKVPAGENYDMVISGTTGSSCGLAFYIFKDGTQVGGNGGGGGSAISHTQTYGTLTSSNVLKVSINGASSTSSSCSVNLKINMQQGTTKLSKNDYSMLVEKANGEYGCQNTGTDTQITLSGANTFPFSSSNLSNSPSYVGYMYGTVYTHSNSNWTSGARFGSSFTWDGTNYTLVDDTVTTPNATHHYSCNVTTANGTCTQIRYVYYMSMSGSYKYYITLTNGDGVEEALVKMQTNTNDSNAKDKIDTWYASNMTSYTNKLEDTIWCNDRSMNTQTNGWIANGGGLSNYIYYSPYGRTTQTYTPSLLCSNKNDSFTWKNGNGNQALDYPVGLLTTDEIMLAGGKYNVSNPSYYLTSGSYYWSLSPYRFDNNYAGGFYVYGMGGVSGQDMYNVGGLRPSVSLKPGTPVISGSGTVSDPYVIE